MNEIKSGIVIGLTGPTGAGKSTAAKFFKELGCGIVDCDVISRDIIDQPACIKELAGIFGEDILDDRGKIKRQELASRAFHSSDSAKQLNDATHPLIIEEMLRQIFELQKTGVKAVVVDAALLFESGANKYCGTTVAVTAPAWVRLKRIMARDGITQKQAIQRAGAQREEEYYTQHARYSINGGKTPQEVSDAVHSIFTEIVGR